MEGPYREAKPLSDLIAPDRRRLLAALIALAGMLAGAGLFAGFQAWRAHRAAVSPPVVTTASRPGWLASTTLTGPDGPVTFPPTGRPAIVNVWLQGCADCMTAFEAAKAIEDRGGLGLDALVVNVAYGKADPAWAARYGVRQNLVYDHGGATIVKPLGISSFTTLVVDAKGFVVHTDRPDRPGYATRMASALGR